MDEDQVRYWSVEDVAAWLHQKQYGQFVENFRRFRIDGVALIDLQEDRFQKLTRSTRAPMGRDDRASMLWRNINIIKRAKSRSTNPSTNPRRPNQQQVGPPEPPQRDYRTEPDDEELYEEYPQTDDDLDDDFTDDEDDNSSDEQSEYLQPEEGPRGQATPQVPSRAHGNLNASWGHPPSGGMSQLQQLLARRMSERNIKSKRDTEVKPANNDDHELYLQPTDDDFYDQVPEGEGENDEIYDIPDDPDMQTGRKPPPSQQQNRMANTPGPRIPPPGRPVQNFRQPVGRGHHHSNDPPAPPIPSRIQPIPATPDDVYDCPDNEEEEYFEPHGDDEFYLKPEISQPGRPAAPSIQNRRLPTLPGVGAAPVPPRPQKPSDLRAYPAPPQPSEPRGYPAPQTPELPPAIPSRPSPGRRSPHPLPQTSKPMPEIPNGLSSSSSSNDRPKTPPSLPPSPSRIPHPQRRPITPPNDNDHQNGNIAATTTTTTDTSATSRRVMNMRNRFEAVDNHNDNNSRKPIPVAKGRTKLPDRQNPPLPPSQTMPCPAPVNPRPTTSVGNSRMTSSTSSVSSMSSNSSNGSDVGPTRRGKPTIEFPSEMPPLPGPTPPPARRPSPPMAQPQLNKSALMRIHDSQPDIPKPSPILTAPTPVSPIRPPPPPAKGNTLEGYPWYHGDIGRQASEQALFQCKKDGAFIVRDSTKGGKNNPLSLSLWFNGRVRNLQIRRREDQKYALGTKKDNEMAFDTPVQLIQHHMTNSLILAQDEGKTILKIPAPVYR